MNCNKSCPNLKTAPERKKHPKVEIKVFNVPGCFFEGLMIFVLIFASSFLYDTNFWQFDLLLSVIGICLNQFLSNFRAIPLVLLS